jgi:hypothetical protein
VLSPTSKLNVIPAQAGTLDRWLGDSGT